MPSRDMRAIEAKITHMDPATRRAANEFSCTISTKNAVRLMEVLARAKNGWAEQVFKGIFQRVFEKRQKEHRPIYFAQGIVEELGEFAQLRKDRLTPAEFHKMIQKYAEPQLARNQQLVDCLYKAAYRVSPNMLAMERGRPEEIAVLLEAFVNA